MEEAIQAYHQITADSEFRERQRLYEKARHNEAAALRHARDEGEETGRKKGIAEGMERSIAETARNLKSLGVSTDIIVKSTGLSPEEIAKL